MASDWKSVESMFLGVSYFHGRLSPEHANFRLNRRGGFHGLYLIYEDIEIQGKYTLAICSGDKIRTYYLGISNDLHITYGNGVTVPLMHPHELIHYHLQKCKDFPVRPLVPCLRPSENDDEPMAWQTVTMKELETRMLCAAVKTSATQAYTILTSDRNSHLLKAARQMHVHCPWYHGSIERDEAERRLAEKPSASFLIRDKEDGVFALSMRYRTEFRHYTISQCRTDDGEMFFMDDEPAFTNLMDMVEHYSTKPNSFVLALGKTCVRPNYVKPDIPSLDANSEEALNVYVKETQHLQHPDVDQLTMSRSNGASLGDINIENLKPVLDVERAQLEIRSPKVKTGNVSEEITKDEDDAMLDAYLSSVLPLSEDVIVTRVFVPGL